MTLRVGKEEVEYTLSDAMKQCMNHDDMLYFANETDLFISDFVQEVMTLNPLKEHLGGLGKEEQEKPPDPQSEQNQKPPEKSTSPSKGKKERGQKESTLKKVWSKASLKTIPDPLIQVM